jgi:hypothetical protein
VLITHEYGYAMVFFVLALALTFLAAAFSDVQSVVPPPSGTECCGRRVHVSDQYARNPRHYYGFRCRYLIQHS